MLLSIIIPVYNVEKYLRQCIESVICCPSSDIQVILVDDGSTDSSGEICDEYAFADKRCMVVHKENKGLSDARNEGLSNAVSDYILYMDSDDFLRPDALDHLIDCLKQYKDADIIQFKFTRVWPNGEERYSDSGLCKFYDNEEAYCNYLQGKIFTRTAWDKVYRKSILKEISYPVGYLAEDYGTTYKIISRAQKLLYYNKTLYCYRQRENSIMAQKRIQLFYDEYELGKQYYFFNMAKYPQYKMLIHSEHINLLLKMYFRISRHPEKDKNTADVLREIEYRLIEFKNSSCRLRTKTMLTLYFYCLKLFMLLMKIKFYDSI